MHSDKLLTEALQARCNQRMTRWTKVYLAVVCAPVLACTAWTAISALSEYNGTTWTRLAFLYGWFVAAMLVVAALGAGLGIVRHFAGRNTPADEFYTAQLFIAEAGQEQRRA